MTKSATIKKNKSLIIKNTNFAGFPSRDYNYFQIRIYQGMPIRKYNRLNKEVNRSWYQMVLPDSRPRFTSANTVSKNSIREGLQ